MSKFIKVTGKLSGEEKIIFTSGIDEIVKDGNDGSVIYDDGSKLFVRESLEQIESQLLRDEFAMAALTGMVSHNGDTDEKYSVSMSYYFADEMLKERMK